MHDELRFFSGSALVRPGKGPKEHVADASTYASLPSDFRRQLSNFAVCDDPIVYKRLSYRTVEHAFQASKIALVDPDRAREFALESGSDLSRADGAAAQKKRKMVQLDADALRIWNVRKDRVMEELWALKFAQPRFKALLKATGDAHLVHLTGRVKKGERWRGLEALRSKLHTGE